MRMRVGCNNVPVEIFSKFKVGEFCVSVDGLTKDVIVRMHETDPEVFNQIFVREDYQHQMLPEYADVIIDAGANVGYSVLFFKAKYPNSKIIALEPDPRNYEMLRKNCGHLADVVLMNAALWNRETKLELQFESAAGQRLGSWGVRTVETISNTEQTTEAYDIPTIMKIHSIQKIDICKIDIEGAEKDVFEFGVEEWVDDVNLFILETHERFRPGSDTTVKSVLGEEKWQYAKKSENQFFKRKLAALI